MRAGARRWAADRAPRLFVRFARPSRAELGRCGEAVAARFVARLGWQLVGRRVVTRWAEVDLVAWDGGQLVAVEVKSGWAPTRGEPRWRPGRHFGPRQERRLERAARALAGPGSAWRVDLIEVLARPPRGALTLVHHRGPNAGRTVRSA